MTPWALLLHGHVKCRFWEENYDEDPSSLSLISTSLFQNDPLFAATQCLIRSLILLSTAPILEAFYVRACENTSSIRALLGRYGSTMTWYGGTCSSGFTLVEELASENRSDPTLYYVMFKSFVWYPLGSLRNDALDFMLLQSFSSAHWTLAVDGTPPANQHRQFKRRRCPENYSALISWITIAPQL